MEYGMIPVKKKPEPENFENDVRQPGMEFLKKVPTPSDGEWKKHSYWRKILPNMRMAYKGICAYSALWISNAHGAENIDHFIPKKANPGLAYEWDNYRFSPLHFNRRKGTNTIIDPFTIGPDWFVMNFPSLLISPNKELPDNNIKKEIAKTINVFKFNEDKKFSADCKEYVKNYCEGKITFDYLERKAPFIAYELRRQGLTEKIKKIMDFSKYQEEE